MTLSASSASVPELTRQRPFMLFWSARIAASMGYQMLALMIGWLIYDITGSALDLGLVGLIQFVPAVVLTLLIGHAADRYDRRLIVRVAQSVYVVAAGLIIAGLLTHTLSRNLLFGAVFMIACGRAFELPTAHAFVPALVPAQMLSRAVAAWTSANQIAIICGPAAGGFIYALSLLLVACLALLFFIGSITLISLVKTKGPEPGREPPTFASVLAGFDYIRNRRRLLGVITLDLFVVMLGGATALLPVYARDILNVGPSGLGLLRSAPAVGALLTTVVMSRYPVERHIGAALFAVVAIYGAATMIFAVSLNFPLSLVALTILGAADAVSIVVRFSLVQIETPDAMRGRVSAINYLFVGSSNTLGDFRAGVNAAEFGAVASVLIGGIGSLLVAGLWMVLFPELRHIDRFQPADKERAKPEGDV